MKCKDCPEGKRYMSGSVYCHLYGIIIREEHECTREGGRRHDGTGTEGDGEEKREGAGLHKDSRGAA